MTEFEKQVAKEGFQTANGKFQGLDEEPKSGTGKKSAWRKAKLRFLLEGKSQENKFILWTPIKTDKSKYKSDEELKQFSMYNITWVEENQVYDAPEGKREWVEKKIVCLNTSTGTNNEEYSLEKLYELYKQKIPEKDRSLEKFSQFYLAANHKSKYVLVKEYYKQHEDEDMGEIIT